MIKNYLFINGVSEVGIDNKNKKYYVNADIINKEGYDSFIEVSLEQFRKVLRDTFKWIPNSWNENLKEEYRKLLEM